MNYLTSFFELRKAGKNLKTGVQSNLSVPDESFYRVSRHNCVREILFRFILDSIIS